MASLEGVQGALASADFTLVAFAAVVHYPLLEHQPNVWCSNMWHTALVFGPVTICECVVAIYLTCTRSSNAATIVAFVALCIAMLVTALVIRLHWKLAYADMFKPDVYARLTRWNVLRVVAWAIRIVCLAV